MWQQNRRITVSIVAGMLLLMVIAGIGLFVAPLARPRANQQQVQQNALVVAQGLGLVGQPTELLARFATRGQLGLNPQCVDPWFVMRHKLSVSTYWRSLCDANTEFWMVRVRGAFNQPLGNTTVWVLMERDGTLIETGNYDFPAWQKMFP